MDKAILNDAKPFYSDTTTQQGQPATSANHGPGSESQQGLAGAAVAAHSHATLGTTAQAAPAAPTQGQPLKLGGKLAELAYPLGRKRLPAALVQARVWLVWKSVPKPDPKAKPDKIPYYVSGARRNGSLDGPEDREKFGIFDEALDAYFQGGYDGLAIALGPDGTGNYWQGFDADNVLPNELDAARANLPGYLEVSPSGKGFHAIGYGRHFKTLGSNGSNVEAYAEKRFFTFTGEQGRGELDCIADFVEQTVAVRHGAAQLRNPLQLETIEVDAQTVTELRSALFHMHSDDYDLWYRMGMALHELGKQGRGIWLDWSSASEKFNMREAVKKWDGFKPNNTGYKAVFTAAQSQGWVNPNSNEARGSVADRHSDTVTQGGFSFKFARPEGAIVELNYLIDPWLPGATVIGCYGRGEAGKSSWAAQICAHASSQVSTLWVSSEERKDHILQRHLSCGGEVATLAVIDAMPTKIDPKTKKAVATSFNIYEHMEQALIEFQQNAETRADRPLGVVVLDAVLALVTWAKGESANDDAGVKRLIAFLVSLAERHGVTFIILGHLNKGTDHTHIADAVTGSAAWTNSVRLAYMFVKDTESENYEGFIRTVKSNTGTHFGASYRTVPVYTLRQRPDGKDDVLCGVEMPGPVVWGEMALRKMMANEDDPWLNKMEQKHHKVQAIVDRTLQALRSGQTTRKVVEGLVADKVSGRHWQEADKILTEQHGVQVRNDAHNQRIYFRAQ